jgi:hypothetical protein
MHGQVVGEDVERLEAREVSRKVRMHHLHEMLSLPQVLKAVAARVPQAYIRG